MTFGRRLWVVVGVAAMTRIVLWAVRWDRPLLLNDSLYYSAQARQLTEGTWFREIFVDQPGAEHGPLTSILLSPVSWMDDPVRWQRLVTALLGVVTVAVVGLVGRRLGGERAGLFAAGVATIYPNLWMNDGLVMSESVSVLLVAIALLVTLRLLDHPPLADRILLGVVLGLGALARSELALLAVLVVALLAIAWRRSPAPAVIGRLAIVALAAIAVLAPWVVFNLVRFQETVLLTTNDGTTLLGASCDRTFTGDEVGGWSVLCVVSDPQYRQDEEPSVRSVRQRRLATDYVRDHVGRLPIVVVARIGRSLDLYALDDLVAQDVGEDRDRWASWAGIGAWWLMALPAGLGVRSVPRRAHRALLLLPCTTVLVTTAAFYGGHRIRSTMEPVVVIGAALWLARRTSSPR